MPTENEATVTPADIAAQALQAKTEQAKAVQAETKTEEANEDGDQGKGSKEALKADLAKERNKRHDLENQLNTNKEQLNKVLAALGLNGDGEAEVDFEQKANQLSEQLRTQQAETAVLRYGNGIADTVALLDSRAFNESLADIDFTDGEAVKAHITEYVTQNPRFSVATPKPGGTRDAAAGNNSGLPKVVKTAPGAPTMAAGFEEEMRKA